MNTLLGPPLMRVAEPLDRSRLMVPKVDETPPPPPDPQAEWTRQIRRARLRARDVDGRGHLWGNRPRTMTTVTPRDTTASVADSPAELTDGCHSVVDSLRVNGVRTVYGLVSIPITDVARAAQSSGCAISALGTKVMQGMLRRPPSS